jgi:multiple sugar transport system ATP-binding protein
MDLGVIQQIGTPLDLYYRPANLFVAGFIGEPPMNTFAARLELAEGSLQLHWKGEGQIALHFSASALPSTALDRLQAYQGQDVMVGVRPQRVRIQPPAPQAVPGQVPGELLVHEFLGNDGIGQVSVDHTQIECVTPPEIPFQAGDAVSLGVEFADLHFFDVQTTRRIETEAR